MVLSLFLILFFGVLGGILFEKIKLPKLIWYLILGVLLGPSVLNLIDDSYLALSQSLRQIALIIILTRSGLSLDLKLLKRLGRPAILMCFLPATIEIIGVTIFAPMILDISIFEAFLLGSILGAVSPAVVVPKMISLMEKGYDKPHGTLSLILAGASCDDIYVIVIFYSALNLVKTNSFNYMSLLNIPMSIILGVLLGIVLAILIKFIFKFVKDGVLKALIVFSLSLFAVYLESLIKNYVALSGLLSVITLSLLIHFKDIKSSDEIAKSYNHIWKLFEIILFSFVGLSLKLNSVFSVIGLKLILVLLIGLLFRSMGVLLALIKTEFNFKEKIFIIISYLPKATVQASIGAIALEEGLEIGGLALSLAAVSIIFSAPLGAILMDQSYKKLLVLENLEESD